MATTNTSSDTLSNLTTIAISPFISVVAGYSTLRSVPQRSERLLEIDDEVCWILKPDVQAHDLVMPRPVCHCARLRKVRRQDHAFVTAPRCPDAEELE